VHYKQFRIKNFKGIKDATIKLGSSDGAGVFTFVGLNESGKTTVLEAIHSFSPDRATSQLVGGDDDSGVPYVDRVPRHLISNFTGDVSVSATLSLTESDVADICSAIGKEHSIRVDAETFPREIILERHQRFEKGDYQKNFFSLRAHINVKTEKQKKWREPTKEEKEKIKWAIYVRTPDIAYFPTFVFNFPKQIFLTGGRGGVVNQFYQRLFQDILDYDGRGHTVEDDLTRRVQSPRLVGPWLTFWSLWNNGDDKEKIQHVIDRAAAAVTEVVFGRWNKIFHDEARGKEVIIPWEVIEGEEIDAKGIRTKTETHDIAIKFQIKDGTRRFDVNDRSLGFRWFFSFMLFTQFRVARGASRPIVFLFDEPASNLHAAAQQKLIESFPEIAKGGHKLIYTTHSHYMIEPKWLEQTFIVTNRADAPSESVLDGVSFDDESLDIKAGSYREFVDKNPTQTSYFQPILDRLEVAPSRFDIKKSSLIVEGKSDYFVLRYALALHGQEDISILPGIGAGTLGALVALHIGWNLDFLFLLDGDKQGQAERARYIEQFGLLPQHAIVLSDLCPGKKEIEDLLDQDAKAIIVSAIGSDAPATKNQIRRFFQERLASNSVISLGRHFDDISRTLLADVAARLAAV